MAEPRPHERRAPLLDLTGVEWKLALTTVLAGAYALLWLGLQPLATEAGEDAVATASAEPPTARTGAARWLQELPPSAREALVPPPGYRFATVEPGSTTASSPPTARPTRSKRVRTRSS
jgi:hypothetical protein